MDSTTTLATDQIDHDEVHIDDYEAAARVGRLVFGALFILSIIEYFVAIELSSPLIPLIGFAAAKGWLIVKFFMHIHDLRGGEHG